MLAMGRIQWQEAQGISRALEEMEHGRCLLDSREKLHLPEGAEEDDQL